MISNKFDPIPSVKNITFKQVYIECLLNKNSDLNKFFKLIDPFKQNLILNFKSKNTDYYFLHFLINNLKQFNITLSDLVKWSKEPTFENDINYLILLRLRKTKSIPFKASSAATKYHFVTNLRLSFVNFLKKKFKYKNNKSKFTLQVNSTYNYEQKINSDYWKNYLFFMLKSGYTVTEISNITKYSRTTLYKELKKYDE